MKQFIVVLDKGHPKYIGNNIVYCPTCNKGFTDKVDAWYVVPDTKSRNYEELEKYCCSMDCAELYILKENKCL